LTAGEFKTWKTRFATDLLQPGEDAGFLDSWERDLQPFPAAWCLDAIASLRASMATINKPAKQLEGRVLTYLRNRSDDERRRAQTNKYTRMETARAPWIPGWSYAEAAQRVKEDGGRRPAAEVVEEYRQELRAVASEPAAATVPASAPRRARRTKPSPANGAGNDMAIAGKIGTADDPAA
jgi:hypothetical protein